ncbi:MAG: dTDP-4-dehydrorhamnose reductase [Scytonematopsis contorta HA4267-MV1]|nr:dTDP-4-dehydrorhamnose reductase [Scytonematopsis contorta HA4267-MV1]
MNNILLIGSKGQVGSELEKILKPKENIIAVARPTIDLANRDTLKSLIQQKQPQIIINAAAYTAVDKAESEPELAEAINTIAPKIIAQEAEKLGAYLIHISTDYVFDGKKNNPYHETDSTNPLSVYGKTKLAGEQAISEYCSNHLILRTAWVYGTLGKSNFVKSMLRLGKERSQINVVADQIGSPTWAKDIAETISKIIPKLTPEIVGTYHYTNSGVASWYDFAVAIFEEALQLNIPVKIERVIPITTSEYPTAANRPLYSVLNYARISTIIDTYPPHWRQRLRLMLRELSEISY